MAKHLMALMALLSVFIFIAGCPQAKLEPIEPNQAETLKIDIRKTEPNKVELSAIEPPKVEPPKAEPPKPEPNEVEPAKIEPPEDELLTTEPTEVQYSAVEPNAIEPNEVEPNYVEAVTRQIRRRRTAPREPGRRVFFHDKCADILNNFVDEDGMVDYRALRRKRLKLKKVLNEFGELDPN